MSNTPTSLRILRGKYRITQNVYVACVLHVLEANDQDMRLFLGVKRRADTMIPVGTKIFLESDKDTSNGLVSLSTTVKELQVSNGKPLLVCAAIQKEAITDRRKGDERRPVDFPVVLAAGYAQFKAIHGSIQGLTLECNGPRALTSLVVNRRYQFSVHYKDNDYLFPAIIKHIHYDWKKYAHRIGIQFDGLSQEQSVVMNLLIDPEYTVQISTKQTVDTSQGKISAND